MTSSRDDLPNLFRSIAAQEEEHAAQDVVRAAEQRWPLLQSAMPKVAPPPPALAPQEREEAWAAVPKPSPGKKPRRSLSVPRRDDTLACSLSKMAEHAPAGDSEEPPRRKPAPAVAPPPSRRKTAPAAAAAPLQAPAPGAAAQRQVQAVDDGLERSRRAAGGGSTPFSRDVPSGSRPEAASESPRMAAGAGRERAAPVVPAVAPLPAARAAGPRAARPAVSPAAPAARQPVRQAGPEPALAAVGGGMDPRLESVFRRVHERASPPAVPLARRPSFMSRLGKR
jgi:hypothetical protein